MEVVSKLKRTDADSCNSRAPHTDCGPRGETRSTRAPHVGRRCYVRYLGLLLVLLHVQSCMSTPTRNALAIRNTEVDRDPYGLRVHLSSDREARVGILRL